ncbi:urease accessory protein UreD [Methylobacterium sp. Leaf86]|uniref:urease accessory protein UreD n=1 Tax=Methylobacterium sp. Leaf86 TaxID=1736242 RepID=UPI0006F43B2E|nr:urease accessory protein UreD [Methylobacterium sp. Leaf86]KQO57655.1 urease accessory protein UreD [Methylobacterium sp. Leaf86]
MGEEVRGASPEGAGRSRHSQARLVFVRGGGTTVLSRQVVPYPFHITRPFRMYPDHPDIATLYLQSASGGLYRADRLGLDITARPGSRALVTTQSATVVHDTGAFAARQDTRLAIASDASLALHPDPMILFPDSALDLDTRIVVGPDARVIVSEGFASHDPTGMGRPFSRIALSLRVETEDGRILVNERSTLDGATLASPASPMGAYAAYGSMVILGSVDCRPDIGVLQVAAEGIGCLCGASPLPNAAGLAVRVLARNGGALSTGMDAVFAVAFAALFGVAPARRRK